MNVHEELSWRKFFILLFAVFSCSCAIFSCPIKESAQADYTKTPIFFVHGHGCYASFWNPMISYLTKSGYPPQYLKAVSLSPKDGSNINAAKEQIAPAVKEFLESINEYIKKEHPEIQAKTKVDMISHSMGALSSRWYAARIRPERLRVWLSLAGANHGSDPCCESSGQGADDMCPAFAKTSEESLIQYVLNGAPHVADIDETPYGIGKDSPGVVRVMPDEIRQIAYFTIRVDSDKAIKPEESAILDGTGGIDITIPAKVRAKETSPGNILMIESLHHDGMLKDKNVMQLVKIILAIDWI